MKASRYLFLVLGLLLFACSGESKKSINIQEASLASFNIDGMVCEHGCAGYLQKKLNKLNGVVKAEISFSNKSATVYFDPSVITEDDVIAEVETANDGQYKTSNLATTPAEAAGASSDGASKEMHLNRIFRPVAFPDVFNVFRRLI